MLDADAGTDGLERDVDRAGQPRRIGRLDHLIVGGPQGEPRRACRRTGRQPRQQGTAGYELLAGLRAGARHERFAERGQAGAVQRGAQRDDVARFGRTVVVDVPQPGHHAAGRVTDDSDRTGPAAQGLVDVAVEHVRLVLKVSRPVPGKVDHDRGPAGRPDLRREHVQRTGVPAVPRDQQHVTGLVRRRGKRPRPPARRRAHPAGNRARQHHEHHRGQQRPATSAEPAPPGDHMHCRQPIRPARNAGGMRSGLLCYAGIRSVGRVARFHDHEGFYVLEDVKPFVIMKYIPRWGIWNVY